MLCEPREGESDTRGDATRRRQSLVRRTCAGPLAARGDRAPAARVDGGARRPRPAARVRVDGGRNRIVAWPARFVRPASAFSIRLETR